MRAELTHIRESVEEKRRRPAQARRGLTYALEFIKETIISANWRGVNFGGGFNINFINHVPHFVQLSLEATQGQPGPLSSTSSLSSPGGFQMAFAVS
jgi:hypothetical protein